MKVGILSMLAVGGVSMIAGGRASAQFTGITVESKPNEFGILVCNVYAEFDAPPVAFIGVGGAPFDSSYSVIDGTFFQSSVGSDIPPNPALFEFFPTLRYDTFVTLGVKSYNDNNPGVPEGQPSQEMVFTPTWPGFGPSSVVMVSAAYGIPNGFAQGNPFNPDFVRGDGGYLIAQLSTEDGTGIAGDLQLNWVVSQGNLIEQFASFVHTVDKACFQVVTEQTICHDNGSAFTFAVDGVESCSGSSFSFSFTGSGGAVGEELCFSVVVNDDQGQECCAVELCTTIPDCTLQALSPFDIDADGVVGILDMLALIGAWGPCSSCFLPGTCPADIDDDCSVAVPDLLMLLANWDS
jgi:hypothetical protein